MSRKYKMWMEKEREREKMTNLFEGTESNVKGERCVRVRCS